MKRDITPAPLDHMIAIVQQLAPHDTRVATAVPFLSLMRASQPSPVTRGVLKPSCCLILQGNKRVTLGSEVLDYGPGEFLLATVELAATGSIVNATPEQPYLLLNMELDAADIAAVVAEAQIDLSAPAQPVRGAFVGKTDGDLMEAWYKLLRLLLGSAQEAAFLSVGLKREILYRLLKGPHGPQLYQNVVLDSQDQGISRAIQWLRERFDQNIKVEELAQAMHMSVSSLHHRFKAVTLMGPLQYQKQLRLQQARTLLMSGDIDAGSTAYRVGYASPSQFSREYRRLFGAPPMEDRKKLRQALALTTAESV
jgi:AraC-like DNA-binding protein